jgi:predicted TIM-barrel fold metal-dependent hydrolase
MTRPPRHALPKGAVDTHFHVFRAGAKLAVPRSYTPRDVTLADWQLYARRARIDRGVLVQPSVYGFDNTVLLDALRAEPHRLRGIVVLDPAADQSIADLEHLHALGVRGARCNTRNLGGMSFETAVDLAARIAPLGWTLQFQVRPEQLDDLVTVLPALGARAVIDHLGFIDLDPPQVAIDKLRTLLDAGNCYIKLSAPYRLSGGVHFAAVAHALLHSHPEHLLWGSDWPHTELWADVPDDAALIDSAMDLLATDALRQLVMVRTPDALFFSD